MLNYSAKSSHKLINVVINVAVVCVPLVSQQNSSNHPQPFPGMAKYSFPSFPSLRLFSKCNNPGDWYTAHKSFYLYIKITTSIFFPYGRVGKDKFPRSPPQLSILTCQLFFSFFLFFKNKYYPPAAFDTAKTQ